METTIENIIQAVTSDILRPIITLLFVLATASFIFGAIKLLLSAKDTKKIEEGRKLMLYGLLGLFTIVAMWGLVYAIKRTFDISERNIPRQGDLPN